MLRADSFFRFGYDANNFKIPTADAFAFVVSHAWSFQTHPDPLGACNEQVQRLLKSTISTNEVQGDTVGFYDFTGVARRPFTENQSERTPAETRAFYEALRAMPLMYMLVSNSARGLRVATSARQRGGHRCECVVAFGCALRDCWDSGNDGWSTGLCSGCFLLSLHPLESARDLAPDAARLRLNEHVFVLNAFFESVEDGCLGCQVFCGRGVLETFL